jgi:hypothetical protein
MKNLIIFAIMVAIFLAHEDTQASSFTLLDSAFSVNGVNDSFAISDSYNDTSTSPVTRDISSGGYSVGSEALYNRVSAYTDFPDARFNNSMAYASTTLKFASTFNGLASIQFSGDFAGDLVSNARFYLTDLTASKQLLDGFINTSGLQVYVPSSLNADSGYHPDFTFTYDAWDPSHVYVLNMCVYAYDDMPNCGGHSHASLWTDMELIPVPEPATFFLLGSSLIALAGLRKKFIQNEIKT